ncbi:GIY-YIG nuclease family protein [Salegentibacter flavus]|uniref:GIY-YIG catalytic domain-containing protein n=1 Tax=Salegentibacter flavus TaxID=287099 RepID=A0A1I4ZUC9_9FLAO|nr:hypothetical protein [Salegentibacter flavus]SFN53767.1 hypothetical protein SAMN05660413_01525 [Salegentibacter flavus]
MTLHAAIEQVLAQGKRMMTPVEIADSLNKNSWYSKKDGSAIKSSQIGARVKNYPHLFRKEGSLISLKSNTGTKKLNITKPKGKVGLSDENLKLKLTLKVLMNEKNFKPAGEIDGNLPDIPGLYCLRIAQPGILPVSFSSVLKSREHNIIYIGIASKSLRKRLNQELRAKGHGTFFRSIGAVLGYVPEKGSLVGKRNQNNYRFAKGDEKKIIAWINENLRVNWVQLEEDLSSFEAVLLNEQLPLLNIAGNPGALEEIRLLRNKCKQIARTKD